MLVKISRQFLFLIISIIFSGFLSASSYALSEISEIAGSHVYGKISELGDPESKKILTELLFSTKVTLGTEYTSDPIGTVDVEKLVQGDDKFWQVQGESRKKLTPKHLVLNDWTLVANNQKNVELKKMIIDFVPKEEDQYKLFVWQVDHLVEIKSEEDLHNIDYASITPISQEVIQRKLFTEYNISSDQAAFLNIANIRKTYQLLNGLADEENWVKITDIFLDKNSGNGTFIALRDIKNIMISVDYPNETEIYQLVSTAQRFKDEYQGYKLKLDCSLDQLVQLTSVTTRPKEFCQLFEKINVYDYDYHDRYYGTKFYNFGRTLLDWQLDNIYLNLKQPQDSSYYDGSFDYGLFDMFFCQNVQEVQWFLQHTPNNVSLWITNRSEIDHFSVAPQLDTIHLNKVRKIYFYIITIKDVQWFLQHAPNIEYMDVHLSDLSQIPESANIRLKNCKKVFFTSEEALTAKNIKWVIDHAPNLSQATLDRFLWQVKEIQNGGAEGVQKIETTSPGSVLSEAPAIGNEASKITTTKQHSNLEIMSLDKWVKFGKQAMTARTIFTPVFVFKGIFSLFDGATNIPPNRYRIGVYNELDQDTLEFLQKPGDWQEIENPFCDHDPKSSDSDIRKSTAKNRMYYGKYKVVIPVNGSVPMPSLSAHETLSHLFIPEIAKAELVSKLKVSYSKAQNLYYLTNVGDTALKITPSFILTLDKPYSTLADVFGEGKINDLVKKFENFKMGTEDINKQGVELFEEIFNKEVGACRHRAQVFMWKIEELKRAKSISENIAVRVIYNDVHAYVEIRENRNKEWVAVNLGGYPANVTDDGKLAEITSSPTKSTSSTSPEEVIRLLQIQSIIRQINDRIVNKKCDGDLTKCELDINTAEREIRKNLDSISGITYGEKKPVLVTLSSSLAAKKKEIEELRKAQPILEQVAVVKRAIDDEIVNKRCADDLSLCETKLENSYQSILRSVNSIAGISDEDKKQILEKLGQDFESKKNEIAGLKKAQAEKAERAKEAEIGKLTKEVPAKTSEEIAQLELNALNIIAEKIRQVVDSLQTCTNLKTCEEEHKVARDLENELKYASATTAKAKELKESITAELISYLNSKQKELDTLREVEVRNQKTIQDQKKFVAAFKEKPALEEVNEFFTNVVNLMGENQNLLLKMPKEDIDATHLLIHKIANKNKKPVYYIDSPDDLVMHTRSLHIGARTPTGVFTSEISSSCPLRDFLRVNQDSSKPNAILIINWHNFPKDKFVSCHSVIDKDRNINNEALPKNMLVVSLYPKNSDACYRGNDFIERHSIQKDSNYDSTKLHEEVSAILNKDKLAPALDGKQQENAYVELNDSEQWLNYVMGSWSITPEGYTFAPGALSKVLEPGVTKSVVLQNAPWDVRDFRLFLQKLALDGHVEYYGKALTIPPGFQFYQKQGFDWRAKAGIISDLSNSETYTINPASFAAFMVTYRCGSNGKLIQDKGILELNAGKKIDLFVTRNITIGQWHELLTKANESNVRLHISLASGVTLPDELEFLVLGHGPQKTFSKQDNVEVYLTKNTDGVVATILKDNKAAKVMTISEHDQSDLFYRIDRVDNSNQFQERKSDVWQALQNGETVILRGHVTPFLADGLASLITQGYFLHNGVKETMNGRLIIVSDSKELAYSQSIAEKNPLVEVSKVKETALIEPDQEQGLSKEISEKWRTDRITMLETALAKKPWVYIEGPTGCGKSTTVNFGLPNTKYMVFNGIEHLEEWVKYQGEKIPVIFIDEANLTGKDFAIFRDLEGSNPAILLQEKYVLLKNHRVILAGNPIVYGAGRHEPELIRDHAIKVIFKSIPSAVLYNDILKPLRPNQVEEAVWQEIASNWLAEYQRVNKDKPSPILTPRQLESMALLFNATLTKDERKSSLSAKAREIANQIYGPYLKNKQPVFTIPKPSAEVVAAMAKSGFTYTDSRYEAYAACISFLKIRDLKIENNGLATIPGLGGVLLSGEPGVGKSVFIRAILAAHNYTEYKGGATNQQRTFIYLASDDSYEHKKELLAKGYENGYIVIIDEVNTPLYESLLNGLVGTKTDKRNTAGFMIFGTQNPAYMPGREITSSATQHRLLPLDLPNYTADELFAIEKAKHPLLDDMRLKEIIAAFIKTQNEDLHSYRYLQTYIGHCNRIISKINVIKKIKNNDKVQSLIDFISDKMKPVEKFLNLSGLAEAEKRFMDTVKAFGGM